MTSNLFTTICKSRLVKLNMLQTRRTITFFTLTSLTKTIQRTALITLRHFYIGVITPCYKVIKFFHIPTNNTLYHIFATSSPPCDIFHSIP